MATLDIICQGWLTKSPPERTLDLFGKFPLRFVTHKWRERYFILHKPSGSLPKEYALDYYRDHTTRKHKGRIDLEQCEEILSALDSAHYEHLFAIKTRHKHRERTYYLAAHTEKEMNKWVECLCSVCGLADEDNGRPADSSGAAHTETAQPDKFDSSRNGHIHTQEISSNQHIDSNQTVSEHAEDEDIPEDVAPPPPVEHDGRKSPSPYQHLTDCRTGHGEARLNVGLSVLGQKGSHDSLASLPDAPPPPPPKEPIMSLDVVIKPPPRDKISSYYVSPPRIVPRPTTITDDSYDVPKPSSHRPISGTAYDVVPPQPGRRPSSEDWYDVPPVKPLNLNASVQLSHSESSWMSQSPPATQLSFSHTDTYDYPRRNSRSSDIDVYDTPPPPVAAPRMSVNNGALHRVPPAPSSKKSAELMGEYHYENLPTNSKSHPDYSAGSSMSSHPEPPPLPRSSDDIYDSPPSHNHSSTRSGLAHSPPPPTPCSKIPHPYVNSPTTYVDPPPTCDNNYVPMTPTSVPSYIPMVDSTADINSNVTGCSSAPKVFHSYIQDDVYISPPNNQPVKPLSSLPSVYTQQLAAPEDQDTYCIMPTQRTRSFKRREHDPSIDKSPNQSVFGRIPLPQRAECIEESSSDDESVESLSKGQKSQKGLSSTPPPPRSGRGEIEYLDLDLKENSVVDKIPAATRSPPGNVSPTDYKEIDFIKTKALCETRKDLENKRKSSDTA